jgi:sodium/proline symporter
MMSFGVLFPFILYLLLVLGIGLYMARRIKNYNDFMIGGRKIGPWVSSFALITSYMSGYTYTAAPGVSYTGGWSAMWWGTGDAPGNALSFGILGRRLRKFSELLGAITLPEYYEKRFKSPTLRLLVSIIIFVFVAMYLVAQWQASGKLLGVTFGTSYVVGAVIGASVVLLYTLLGGYLAVVYTDFVQGLIMYVATQFLFFAALAKVGGFAAFNDKLGAISPDLVTPFGPGGGYAGLLLAAGPIILLILGSFGLPHVTVRHLSLKNPDTARKSMLITAIFVATFSISYYMIGAVSLVLLGPGIADIETTGVRLWFEVLSPTMAGVMVSAAVASIMSTADGFLMLLVSTIAHDILYRFLMPKAPEKQRIMIARLTAAAVAILTFVIALNPPALVFTIVIFAFGGMALAFGVPNLFSVFWKRSTEMGALASIVLSMVTYVGMTVAKVSFLGLNAFLTSLVVGILAFVLGSLASKKPTPQQEKLFDIGTAYGPLPAGSANLAVEVEVVEEILSRQGTTKRIAVLPELSPAD